jgi:thymidylate synthase
LSKGDRTGTGTKVFSAIKCALSEGFPMVTTKKLHFKSIVYELPWFLKAIQILNTFKSGVKIWDAWANGELGPVYGHQWRNWNSEEIDQIQFITELKRTQTVAE